jgi:hypothetical protein
MAGVTVHWHDAEAIRATEPAVRAIVRAIEAVAKRRCPKVTGRLANDITGRVVHRAGRPIGQIGNRVDYAEYVHNGTGIHGPRRQRIQAKPGRYFAFRGRSGTMVYVTSHQGQRPQPYLLAAVREVVPNARIHVT